MGPDGGVGPSTAVLTTRQPNDRLGTTVLTTRRPMVSSAPVLMGRELSVRILAFFGRLQPPLSFIYRLNKSLLSASNEFEYFLR